MMTNKQKAKGRRWEHDATDILNKNVKDSFWKVVPASGALGTTLEEPLLTGDISGNVSSIVKKFRAECKVGYNSSTNKEIKQFTLKKDWLDKIKYEANLNYCYSVLFGKFDNARAGVSKFAVLSFEDFIDLLNYTTDLKKELDLVYEKLQEAKKPVE